MNMPRKNRRVMLAVLLSSGVIGAACPSVAFAEALQGASSPSDTPPAEVAGPESTEIVVTAQKREERVQDVPAAVSVDRKSTRLNSSHSCASRMPSSVRKQKDNR